MTANKNYSTHLSSYSEAAALQQLMQAAADAIDAENQRFEADSNNIVFEEFTITVAGVQTAFILGGVQYQALVEFVKSIADENFYAVDFDKQTVED